MRALFVLLASVLVGSACASAKPSPGRTAARSGGGGGGTSAARTTRTVRDTVAIQNAELERRVSRLELRLLEREAQVEDLQARLEDARAEVVRAMAKLVSGASRAEAASGTAEAEVALQSLRASGTVHPSEVAQVAKLVRQSSAEFDRQNYAGALYLANQAKALAASYRGRGAEASRGETRPGETSFALPVRLRAASRGNVRQGPGTSFSTVFAVEPGAALTGLSYTDEWVRISDDAGRSGWIFRSLLGKP